MKTFASKEKRSVSAMRKTRPYVHHPMGAVQQAQQAEVRHILRSTGAQARLTIGQPDDEYEQEADHVADQVMRMPDPKLQRQPENEEEEEMLQAKPLADQITPLVQRQEEHSEDEEEPVQAKAMPGQTPDIQRICPECEKETAQRQPMEEEEEELQPGYDQEPEESTPIMESVPTRDAGELGGEEEELLQLKSDTGVVPQVTSGIARDIHSIKGSGQPLSKSERAFFEPRFGIDFSQVRVHSDSRAASLAKSLNARAFTIGRDVIFGVGQFSPGSRSEKQLLAHELTHVLQQNQTSHISSIRLHPSPSMIQRDRAKRSMSLNSAQIKKIETLWAKYKNKYASSKRKRLNLFKLLKKRSGISLVIASMKQAGLNERAKFIFAIRLVALSMYDHKGTTTACIDSVHHLLMKEKQLLGKKLKHFEWGRITTKDVPHSSARGKTRGWRQRGSKPSSTSFFGWGNKINLKLKKPLQGSTLNITDLKVGRAIIWDYHKKRRSDSGIPGHAIGIVHVDAIKKYMVVTWGVPGSPVDLHAYYIGISQSYARKMVQTPFGKLRLRRWKGRNRFRKAKEYFLAEHK